MNTEIVRAKFEEAVASHELDYEKYFLSRFFDLKFEYRDEICIVEVPVEDYMYNTHGNLHGGVISFILDMSMAHLCRKFLGRAVTIEMKTQYLSAVNSGIVRCTAAFLKKGKTIVHAESRMSDQDGKPIAHATATFYVM
jgi:acyl-CoA thioesterase